MDLPFLALCKLSCRQIDMREANFCVDRLTSPAAAAKSTTSPYSPAGAANAGLAPSGGALSIRPLSALTSVGSGLLALFALAL